jgi:hypothetical protein
MSLKENAKLIQQASRLWTLGLSVDKHREKLRCLVQKKVPYDAPQMKMAMKEFETANSEWKRLEQEHLDYRSRLVIEA